MNLNEIAIYVTDHAIARYRERVAEYADASADDLIVRVRQSEPGNPYPQDIPDLGKIMLYNNELRCVFVCDQRANGLAVVTVRCPPNENKSFINPKKKIKRKHAPNGCPDDPSKWIATTPGEVASIVNFDPPEFVDIHHAKRWWKAYVLRVSEIRVQFAGQPFLASSIRSALAVANRELLAIRQRFRKETKARQRQAAR